MKRKKGIFTWGFLCVVSHIGNLEFWGCICFSFLGKVIKNLGWDFSKNRRKCCVGFSLRRHSRDRVSVKENCCILMSEKTGSSKWWGVKNKKIGHELQSFGGGLERPRGWIQWKPVINRTIMEEEKYLSYILWVNPINCPCDFWHLSLFMTGKFKYSIDLVISPFDKWWDWNLNMGYDARGYTVIQ